MWLQLDLGSQTMSPVSLQFSALSSALLTLSKPHGGSPVASGVHTLSFCLHLSEKDYCLCWPVSFSPAHLLPTPTPITAFRGMRCSDWLGLSHMFHKGAWNELYPEHMAWWRANPCDAIPSRIRAGIDQEKAQGVF